MSRPEALDAPEQVPPPSARSGTDSELSEVNGGASEDGRKLAVRVYVYGPGVSVMGSLLSLIVICTVSGKPGQSAAGVHVATGGAGLEPMRRPSVSAPWETPLRHVRRTS